MKKIDCLTLGEMCSFMLDGEPVFILRAQDAASVQTLDEYLKQTTVAKGGNRIRTEAAIQRFKNWQRQHESRVRPAD